MQPSGCRKPGTEKSGVQTGWGLSPASWFSGMGLRRRTHYSEWTEQRQGRVPRIPYWVSARIRGDQLTIGVSKGRAFWLDSAVGAQRMDGDSGLAGVPVYRVELDEQAKTLKLWVRRKPVHRGFECSGCGRRLISSRCPRAGNPGPAVERLSRDGGSGSAWLRCPECGVGVEKIEQLPTKAPFRKRFEEIVGQACERAAASQVARRFQLPETTVRAVDMRYLERSTLHQYAHGSLRAPGRGDERHLLVAVAAIWNGQPFTAGQDGSILDPVPRDLRELGVHHARRHDWHGRRESNLGSRPSRATLARKSGRGRIPERGRFDYRLLRACAVGSSGQDLAMNNACWVEQIDIQIGAPR